MVSDSTAQDLTLTGLCEGRRYGLLITNAPVNVTLQAKPCADTVWRDLPNKTFTAAAAITDEFVCYTPNMRLHFASAPGQTYHVSCVEITMPTF